MEGLINQTRPRHGIECPHCGFWHYGKGTMRETVVRDAKRQVEKCRFDRKIRGLEDEKLELPNPTWRPVNEY